MMSAAQRLIPALAMVLGLASGAVAAECGNTSAGFETWKQDFSSEVKGKFQPDTIDALMGTTYSRATIGADRGQKSFKLTLDQFMAKRGASAVASKGRSMKAANAQLFSSIERRFGVPPGPLIAIWGMETAFGSFTGNQNTLSAVATLAYDCRRTEYFTDQLMAMLTLVDRGVLSPNSRGAMHGEVGQTQFLPKNVMLYGVDGDGDGRINLDTKADALASTANFLKAHGWQAGAGYQPGQPNFSAIEGWNAATVYQQTIAIVGAQIDGNRSAESN